MITFSSYTPVPFATVSADLKKYIRVDHTSDDTLLETLWLAAQEEWRSITHNILGSVGITYTAVCAERVVLPMYPVASVTSVHVDGTEDTEFETITTDARYIIEPSIQGDEITVVYSVEGELNAEIKLALFQHVKFAYDYGDNLPYTGSRYFDRIAMRYKETFAA